jgi:hypothetical protein
MMMVNDQEYTEEMADIWLNCVGIVDWLWNFGDLPGNYPDFDFGSELCREVCQRIAPYWPDCSDSKIEAVIREVVQEMRLRIN